MGAYYLVLCVWHLGQFRALALLNVIGRMISHDFVHEALIFLVLSREGLVMRYQLAGVLH